MRNRASSTQISFSHQKLLSLPSSTRNKWAARLVRVMIEEGIHPQTVAQYRCFENSFNLPRVDLEFEALSNRFHLHLQRAHLPCQEHHLLNPRKHRRQEPWHLEKGDAPSTVTPLPLIIYLDDLRSTHNVGSIVRTIEAFRLGKLCLSQQTPQLDHPQVLKTAQGSVKWIETTELPAEGQLPSIHPTIALETLSQATPIEQFHFPSSFTLVVGNEERGISHKMLDRCDQAVRIELPGYKNSINVACAFAIAAHRIACQLRSA